MNCKVIISADAKNVEQDVNAWLHGNVNAKIFSITQVPHGNRTVLTSIFYQ